MFDHVDREQRMIILSYEYWLSKCPQILINDYHYDHVQ